MIWARFLSPARSKLRLCLANHRAGYFSNLACDWLSTVWAYSEQETENRPWLLAKAANFHPMSIVISMFCVTIIVCLLCKTIKLLSLSLRHCTNLNDYGFNTWITRLCELADHYKIDYDKATSLSPKQFKLGCAETVKNNFINRWVSNINADQSTRMRTYASFKKILLVKDTLTSFQLWNTELP